MMPVLMGTALLATLAGLAHREPEVPQNVVAIVNGEQVHLEDLRIDAEGNSVEIEDVDDATVELLLERAIATELIFQRGDQLGLVRTDPVLRGRMMQLVREYALESQDYDAIGEAELRDFYQQHQEDYLAPGKVRFQEVFVVGSREPADEAHRRLVAGESVEGVARSLGQRPPFSWGDGFVSLQRLRQVYGAEVADAVAELDVGSVSLPVVGNSGGYHVMKLAERQQLAPRSFEDVKDRIRADIERGRSHSRLREWTARLREEADVWVVPDTGEKVRQAWASIGTDD